MSYLDFDFPNTAFYRTDLREILKIVKKLVITMKEFINMNVIKFADPIEFDITKQYEKSTIVVGSNGNAYLSKQPVPAGINLNNDEYWLLIFDFDEYTEKANKNFTDNYFKNVARSDRNIDANSWIVLDDVLYKAATNILAYEPFVIGTNLVHFTVEDFLKDFVSYVSETLSNYSSTIQQYKNDIDASELQYRNQLAGDIANITSNLNAQLAAAISGVTVDSEVINARIGEDGVTYLTLGDAIRTQFKHVNSNIKALSWPSKNLLHLNNLAVTINGVVAEVTNKNHIKYVGTATSSGGRDIRLSDNFLLSAGTYTLSTPKSNGRGMSRFYINNAADNVAIAFVAVDTKSITFTLASDTTCYVSQIVISGTDYNDEFDVMLERGSIMTEFTPPVDAYDSVTSHGVHDLKRNVSYITQDEYDGYLYEDGSFVDTSSYHSYVTDYIACNPGDIFYYKGRGAYDAQSYVVFNDLKEALVHGILGDEAYLAIPDINGAMYVRFASVSSVGNPIPELVVYRANPKNLNDIANPLRHKKAVFDGDSICYGNGTETEVYGKGYAGRIKVDNDMYSCINLSVDGATITAETYYGDNTPRHWICRNIENIRDNYGEAEYIIIEGGVNDADLVYNGTIPLGTYNENNFTGPFNDTTFYGAMDSLCKSLLEYFPYKKIGFVLVHKMGVGSSPLVINRKLFMGYVKKVCEKWGIPVIDLWKDSQLRMDIPSMYNPEYSTVTLATAHGYAYYAGGHLTKYGYDVISPKIAAFMKNL